MFRASSIGKKGRLHMKDIVAFVVILSVCSPAVNATDQVPGLVGAGALMTSRGGDQQRS